jgi:hypothetical protein
VTWIPSESFPEPKQCLALGKDRVEGKKNRANMEGPVALVSENRLLGTRGSHLALVSLPLAWRASKPTEHPSAYLPIVSVTPVAH